MTITVYTLLVKSPDSRDLGLSVHGSRPSAIEALRDNYASDYSEDSLADLDEAALIAFVEDQNMVVTIEEHEIVVPAA